MKRLLYNIHGAGGGGKGEDTPRVPVEAPNTLQSIDTARVIDVISEGEIEGLVNGAKSIYYDDTPLQNDDDSYNFSSVTYAERTGQPTQDYIPGFSQVEAATAVNTSITNSSPVTRQITDANINAVRIAIKLPSGLSSRNADNGDLNPTSVTLAIDVQENGGGFVEQKQVTISGKTTSPYIRNYRIELNSGGNPWDIRLRRITADSGSSLLINATQWATYTTIIDAKLYYPDTALIASAVNAREFSNSIPRRAYDIKGLKVKIPSNYNPITRVYTGIWDGTFTTAWTDNPAWCLYDILTSVRYGLGDFIDAAQVDKWELYNISQFCDELVDDGFGGTEPRYTFNAVFNAREDVYTTLQAIASNFHGQIYWGPGTVSFSQDRDNIDPIKLVTPANVIDGLLNYSGTSWKNRHSAALVTWNDPEDGYKAAVEVVEDSALIDEFGWKPADIIAFGCTSRGQAYRYGKWLLVSEQYETERLTYQASFDHADLRPGDIISVADPAYAGVRFGGRVAARTFASITIDSAIELEVAESYEISVLLADGTLETRDITNSPGSGQTVMNLSSSLTSLPLVGSMWVITATNVEPRQFKIISVSEADKNIFDISAVFHDPDKFTRIETDIYLEENDYSNFPVDELPVVTSIQAQEYTYRSGGAILSAARISWEPPTDPREVARIAFYDVQFKKPDQEEFEPIGTPSEPSIDIFDLVAGNYTFRVRVLDSLGAAGEWTTQVLDLLGAAAPPSDVENFSIQVVGSGILLTWNPVPDIDLANYRIRYAPALTGVTWGSSVDIATNVIGNQITLAALTGTYLIKAVDVYGSESVNAALTTSTVAALLQFNVVQTFTESPDYLGVKENVYALDGQLQLGDGAVMADWTTLADVDFLVDGVISEGTYYFDANYFDLGAVFTSRLTASFDASGENRATSTPVEEGWNVDLQIRTTEDDPSGSPTWGEWQSFAVGDYVARAFEWRMKLFSTVDNVTPLIENLEVVIDMPDRVEGDSDITCPASGLSVTYNFPFKVRPALAVDGQDLNTGDYKTVTSQDENGFNVQFFNSSNVGVERTFDYIAKGYGAAS